MSNQKLKVWYGYAKLTKKMVRKPQLVIFYENSYRASNENWVKQKIHIAFERMQTELEMTDGKHSNRAFTKYGYFINDKPFYGEIDKVLEYNFLVETKSVTVEEKTQIMEKLKATFETIYKGAINFSGQYSLSL